MKKSHLLSFPSIRSLISFPFFLFVFKEALKAQEGKNKNSKRKVGWNKQPTNILTNHKTSQLRTVLRLVEIFLEMAKFLLYLLFVRLTCYHKNLSALLANKKQKTNVQFGDCPWRKLHKLVRIIKNGATIFFAHKCTQPFHQNSLLLSNVSARPGFCLKRVHNPAARTTPRTRVGKNWVLH